MSAHKHKTVGGRKQPLSQAERCERYVWRLSTDVSKACDNFQLRTNGYKPTGFRSIINASVLKAQSEKGLTVSL
jgi:hypothetical protein